MTQEQPQQFITMSSVREDPAKRPVPLDFPKFLLEARLLGQRISGPGIKHLHLIGDACLLAVKIAQRTGNYEDALRYLRQAFDLEPRNEGQPSYEKKIGEYERKLSVLTQQKLDLVRSLATVLGLQMETASSIRLLRERKDIAERVLELMGAIFPPSSSAEDAALESASVDVRRLKSLASRSAPHEWDHLERMEQLGRKTLPERLRNNVPRSDQRRQSFYAAIEIALAAALIERDKGQYASYRGSERAHAPTTTIIDNMVELGLAAIHRVDLNLNADPNTTTERLTDFYRNVHINPLLDGVGISEEKGSVVLCDPHTNEAQQRSSISSGKQRQRTDRIQKIPFLNVDPSTHKLVPATLKEIEDGLLMSGGGIYGRKEPLFLSNLGPLVAFLEQQSPDDTECRENFVCSRDDIVDWLVSANNHLDAVRNGASRIPRVEPLVPDRNVKAVCRIIHALATETVRVMEEQPAAGNNDTQEEVPVATKLDDCKNSAIQ